MKENHIVWMAIRRKIDVKLNTTFAPKLESLTRSFGQCAPLINLRSLSFLTFRLCRALWLVVEGSILQEKSDTSLVGRMLGEGLQVPGDLLLARQLAFYL